MLCIWIQDSLSLLTKFLQMCVALEVNGRAQTSALGVLGTAQSAGLAKLFDPATWWRGDT